MDPWGLKLDVGGEGDERTTMARHRSQVATAGQGLSAGMGQEGGLSPGLVLGLARGFCTCRGARGLKQTQFFTTDPEFGPTVGER